MATLRKFEILNVELNPGGPGPERLYIVKYRAIKNKQWIEGYFYIVARNEKEARNKAEQRWGGKL
jgi:hypothetical protein